jgi:integrase
VEQLDLFSLRVTYIGGVTDNTATTAVDAQAEAAANTIVPAASLSADSATATHAEIVVAALPAMIETSTTAATAATPNVPAAREEVDATMAAPAGDSLTTTGGAIGRAPIGPQPPAPALIAPTPVYSFADLLPHIRSWTDLPGHRRKDMEYGVIACSKALGRNLGVEHAPLTAFRVDVAWLNKNLFTLPPKAHGFEKESFGNYVSLLRVCLRRIGLVESDAPVTPPPDGPWPVLLSTLNCTFGAHGLNRFAAWCHERGIVPDAVSEDTVAGFEEFLSHRILRENIRHHIGDLAKAWRRLIRNGAVKASRDLLTPNRRKRYVLPASAYPTSFGEDLDRLARRLARSDGRGPFRGDGPAKALRPRSIKARMFNLLQAAAALVIHGRDPATICGLADLVEQPAFELILTHYWNHTIEARLAKGELKPDEDVPYDAGVTSQTGAIASALMLVARHYCHLPGATIEVLADLAKDLRPPMQTAINAATRALHKTHSVPATRTNLLHLPGKLMKEAGNLRADEPLKAARLAMIAAAIEFELMIPLRIGNLTELQIGHHLRRLDPRTGLISLLSIPRDEMKNDQLFEMPMAVETARFLETYIRDWRPLLRPGDDIFLFPSGQGDHCGHRSEDTIRIGIVEAIAEHVGVKMRVHDFRAFTATLLLEDSPGALEDVRLLLGHKTMLTAERYYAYLKPSHASSRYQQVLKRARQGASAALISSGDGPAPRRRKHEVKPKGRIQDDGQDQGQQAEPSGNGRDGHSPRKPKARS